MKKLFTIDVNEKILKLAGVFGIGWGLLVTFIPELILRAFGVDIPQGIEFWQLTGVAVAALGLGYYISSQDVGRFWPVVLVGFLLNIFGSLIFAKALILGSLPPLFASLLLISTLLWPLPFYYILTSACDEMAVEESPPKQFTNLIRFVRTSQHKTLLELSNEQKVLLVFIRHFGCTFCRETVSEIAKIDEALLEKKLTLVYVHMSDPDHGDEFFSKYYNHPVHHISDPSRALYKSLNLRRGSLHELFGPMTWIRAFYAGIFKGHGVGEFEGDIMQLGGVFVLSKGHVIYEQKAVSASHVIEIKTLPEI